MNSINLKESYNKKLKLIDLINESGSSMIVVDDVIGV